MSLPSRIRAYYRALEEEAPLAPFFAREERPVKFGITETLVGYEAVVESLQSQTETTTDWSIESQALRTGQAGKTGWFSDEVAMAWRSIPDERDIAWETRWSGTLVLMDGEWRFVRMHVSAVPPEGL